MLFLFCTLRRKVLGISFLRRTVSYKISNNIADIMNNLRTENTNLQSVTTVNTDCRNCTKFTMTVVTNGASESNCLMVETDYGRYLFNCGEGVQRATFEHFVKLSKLCAVFITSSTWANIGGLMGVALGGSSTIKTDLSVYGPPSIEDVVHATKNFVFLRGTHLSVVTNALGNTYDDGKMRVKFVPVYEELSKSVNEGMSLPEVTENDNHQTSESDAQKSTNRQAGVKNIGQKENTSILCYICETPEYGGHLDVKACMSKGVPNGPLLGILKNQRDVYLKDGSLVRWKDVLSIPAQSSFFIVVDCPSVKYLQSLINQPELQRFQTSPPKNFQYIIHFTPSEVMNTSRYKEWMARFSSDVTHIKINSDNHKIDLLSVHGLQTQLNFIHPDVFPLLEESVPEVKEKYSEIVGLDDFKIFTCKDLSYERNIIPTLKPNTKLFSGQEILKRQPDLYVDDNGLNIVNAVVSLHMSIHPRTKYDFMHAIGFNRNQYIYNFYKDSKMQEKMIDLKNSIERWEESENYSTLSEYPKVLFLGTGSSMPQKLRNTSAILIELNKDNMVLFDCGEGTYRQLVRFFGYETLGEIFRKLKLVFISHHHADHHLGLVNVLNVRSKFLRAMRPSERKEMSDPLWLILPDPVYNWIEYRKKLQPDLLYNAYTVKALANATLPGNIKDHMTKMGIFKVELATVVHCYCSFGISLTDVNGYKITYSGDCIPSADLIKIGMFSDLLIHEATFEDGLEKMALWKKHSTLTQAIDVGKKMDAKHIVVTHFSQRYAHIPLLSFDFPHNVYTAFDNMMVSPKNLPIIHHFIEIYRILFAEKISELEKKTMKRRIKDEKKSQHTPVKVKVKPSA